MNVAGMYFGHALNFDRAEEIGYSSWADRGMWRDVRQKTRFASELTPRR